MGSRADVNNVPELYLEELFNPNSVAYIYICTYKFSVRQNSLSVWHYVHCIGVFIRNKPPDPDRTLPLGL